MYVCLCKGLTEADIRRMAPKRELCPETFKAYFGFDDEECCGQCAENVAELIAIAKGPCSRTMNCDSSVLPRTVQEQEV